MSGNLLSSDDALDIALNHESSEIGEFIGEFMVWGAVDTDIALGELYALIYALDTSLDDVTEASELCSLILSAFELEYHNISYSYMESSDFITFTAKINDYKPIKEPDAEEEAFEENEATENF